LELRSNGLIVGPYPLVGACDNKEVCGNGATWAKEEHWLGGHEAQAVQFGIKCYMAES